MTKDDYMSAAIDAAKTAAEAGGVAIGAVLVSDVTGEILVSGGSLVYVRKDPTAHAEVNCIRDAAKMLENPDLYKYTLYSTLEPCHMCLSAATWAKIKTIYFGAYRKDVDPSLFDIKPPFSDEEEAVRMNLRENTSMEIHGGVLELDCAFLLKDYHASFAHTTQD